MREENKKSKERKRGKGKDMQPAPLRRKVGRNGQKVVMVKTWQAAIFFIVSVAEVTASLSRAPWP